MLCSSPDRNGKLFVVSLYFFLQNKSDLRSSLLCLEKNKGGNEKLKCIAGLATKKEVNFNLKQMEHIT